MLVTGASRGLGRAMAVATAQAGAAVTISGRDERALTQTAELVEAAGARCAMKPADIDDEQAVEEFVAWAWDANGPVDVLFANAGISLVKPAIDTSWADFESVMRTNVLGTFCTVREIGRRMLERGRGKIITISSDIGLRGVEGWVAYGSSKAAINVMTKTLAWEWAPTVTVNAIAPGAFRTDINADLLGNEAILAAVEAATPLGRVGDAQEIGPLAVYLAGAGSDFMTGAVIPLDGGIRRS